jgi:hypothetical protein
MKRDDAYDYALRRERIAASVFGSCVARELWVVGGEPREEELRRLARRAVRAADVLLAELRRAEKEGNEPA